MFPREIIEYSIITITRDVISLINHSVVCAPEILPGAVIAVRGRHPENDDLAHSFRRKMATATIFLSEFNKSSKNDS